MKKTLTEQIVETIIFLGHATINDIYCDIKALKPNVQKGRIEKIIFTLCENGTIEKLKVDGFDDYYEISKGPHNHFICSTCGKVININSQVSLQIMISMEISCKISRFTYMVYVQIAIKIRKAK